MKLEHAFEVAAPVDRVWDTLIDLEQVAPCLPGAAIVGHDDDGTYHGTFQVKLGPTTASYRGTIRIQEADAEAHVATLAAKGSDKRGQGGATATIVNTLHATDTGGTRVEAVTDFTITGRLASFGRGGMIKDISNRLLRDFSTCLQQRLDAEPAATSAGEGAATTAGEGAATTAGEGAATSAGEGAATTAGEGAAMTAGEAAASAGAEARPEQSATAAAATSPSSAAATSPSSASGTPSSASGTPSSASGTPSSATAMRSSAPPPPAAAPISGISLVLGVLGDRVKALVPVVRDKAKAWAPVVAARAKKLAARARARRSG